MTSRNFDTPLTQSIRFSGIKSQKIDPFPWVVTSFMYDSFLKTKQNHFLIKTQFLYLELKTIFLLKSEKIIILSHVEKSTSNPF
jgi:hypothetical protein